MVSCCMFQICSGSAVNAVLGTQFAYLGELFPNHIRAKGICLGVSMISLLNIIWLQSAPTAFAYVSLLALLSPQPLSKLIKPQF